MTPSEPAGPVLSRRPSAMGTLMLPELVPHGHSRPTCQTLGGQALGTLPLGPLPPIPGGVGVRGGDTCPPGLILPSCSARAAGPPPTHGSLHLLTPVTLRPPRVLSGPASTRAPGDPSSGFSGLCTFRLCFYMAHPASPPLTLVT